MSDVVPSNIVSRQVTVFLLALFGFRNIYPYRRVKASRASMWMKAIMQKMRLMNYKVMRTQQTMMYVQFYGVIWQRLMPFNIRMLQVGQAL